MNNPQTDIFNDIRLKVVPDPARPNAWHLSWFCDNKDEWFKMLAKVRELPGRLWIPSAKCWAIPDNPVAVKAARSLGFTFPEKPTQLPGAEQQPGETPVQAFLRSLSEVPLNPSRPVLSGLRPYQVDFLRYMEQRNGRGALGDDMGTGKTVQSLGWLAYASQFPALIVVTATTKLQWLRVFTRGPDKWVGGIDTWRKEFSAWKWVRVLEGRRLSQLDPKMSYIINWDILADWAGRINGKGQFVLDGPLSKIPFKTIIGDEIQAIGNPTSQRSKAFRALAKRIPGVLGMSGTPARSKPAQFWPLLNLVAPETFADHRRYLNRYCGPASNGFGMTYDGASHTEELHALIAPLILRRTKADVMKDLPPKTIEVVPVEVSDHAMSEYKRQEELAFNSKDLTQQERRDRVMGLLNTAYAMKEQGALRWIKDFMDSGEQKLVLFCWHRDVVELLMNAMKSYHPIKINGEVTGAARDKAVQRFVSDPNCRMVVANIQAGGVGLDGLQNVCSYTAFVEFSHTPNDHTQAEDRLHRGGQDNPVTAYYLVAPGTVDDDAIESLDRKRQMLNAVLDGKACEDSDLLTEILAKRGY